MSKIFVGMVTFGGLKYTAMALEATRKSTRKKLNYVIVVGKPGDKETVSFVEEFISKHGGADSLMIIYDKNYGFPYSLNDIYDVVWGEGEDNYLIVMGNDVVPYPKAITRLIKAAGQTDYDYISGMEMNINRFVEKYPQFDYFFGENGGLLPHTSSTFMVRSPWKKDYKERGIARLKEGLRQIGFINGFHNFALMKKSYFDKVGYIDVGFFPAYYEDTDYVRRGFEVGCIHAEHSGAYYFHFWSRTIKEQSSKINQRYFPLNGSYFKDKWGGAPTQPLHNVPFAGAEYKLYGSVLIPPQDINISERVRSKEEVIINYWKWTPKAFRNKHLGQRVIIAANGPSLNDVNFKLLKDDIIIGMNRGYLKEDMRLTYLVCCNGQVQKDYGEEIIDVPTKATFITAGQERLWQPHVYGMRYDPTVRFCPDFDAPIYQGHTVSFIALQLAYYMGFSKVILIGLDHNYPRAEGHKTNKLIVSVGEDTDHFDPKYFEEGVTWETPNLPRSEEAYQLAKDAFEGAGRAIINASSFSNLEVFDRMDLKEALK